MHDNPSYELPRENWGVRNAFDDNSYDEIHTTSKNEGFCLDDFLEDAPRQTPPSVQENHSEFTAIQDSIAWPTMAKNNEGDKNWFDELLNPTENVDPQQELSVLEAPAILHEFEPISAPPEPGHHRDSRDSTPREKEHHHDKKSYFAEALGLDVDTLSPDKIREIEALGGELVRELLAGILNVIHSRSTIKSEFRMNVTTIQPIENNPLKFSANADDAIENLFLKKRKGYKSAVEAVNECMTEVADHQIAVVTGIQKTFNQMIDKFDPDKIEAIIDNYNQGTLLSAISSNNRWKNYKSYFKAMTDKHDYAFQNLFGSDFISAYEDQIRQLKKQGK